MTGSVWIPHGRSAILGISQHPQKELNLCACRDEGVNIIRRQSGGGAVILDESVLCFEFFAPAGEIGREMSIRESFRVLTGPVCQAIFRRTGVLPVMAGISDLAAERVEGMRKICGCAQMRKRQAVLVHGSILVNTDTAGLERLLAWPSETPDYRQKRSHAAFCLPLRELTGGMLDLAQLADLIREECCAAGWDWDGVPVRPSEPARELIRSKYAATAWNLDRQRPVQR